MDPILRRSSYYYATSLVTYMALMGRYFITRSWPVFEIIPMFMPVWLAAALLASESDESYAFLRTLPVAERSVARRKFSLILGVAVVEWILMFLVAWLRTADGVATSSTFVFLTLVCAAGMLAVAGLQIAVWRFGLSAVRPPAIVALAVALVLLILHTFALKRVDAWFAFSELGPVEWLGGAPWLWIPVIAAITLLMFSRLVRIGVRVKAASEAHL
jgi:hypothetical protein